MSGPSNSPAMLGKRKHRCWACHAYRYRGAAPAASSRASSAATAAPTSALCLTSAMLAARLLPPVAVRMRSSRKGVTWRAGKLRSDVFAREGRRAVHGYHQEVRGMWP